MKYILTGETETVLSKTLYRIKAIKNFQGVRKGEIGGLIEKEENLSQEGNCWIANGGVVMDNARVSEDAVVCTGGFMCDSSQAKGKAMLGRSGALLGNSIICGDAFVNESLNCDEICSKYPVTFGNVYGFDVIVTDKHIKLDNDIYEKEELKNMSDEEFLKECGETKLRFWKYIKTVLLELGLFEIVEPKEESEKTEEIMQYFSEC